MTSKTPTLSQLADIGAEAAMGLKGGPIGSCIAVWPKHGDYPIDREYREAFAKAVLDAVGYKLPVDPERETFDAWLAANPSRSSNDDLFDAWKAGRAARDKEVMLDKQPNPTDKADDPSWIEWKGGPCPIPDTVKRWEYRCKDGFIYRNPSKPSEYAGNWENSASAHSCAHFVAYRVLDWGTAKTQPETFEAHGYTWFKHTPGDPMPCDPSRRVQCMFENQQLSGRSTAWTDDSKVPGFGIIGWRYAE